MTPRPSAQVSTSTIHFTTGLQMSYSTFNFQIDDFSLVDTAKLD